MIVVLSPSSSSSLFLLSLLFLLLSLLLLPLPLFFLFLQCCTQQLESGEVVYHINISSVEETVRASGIPVGDVRWHMVDVLRSGLAVSLTIDSNSTFQHTLAGNALILNIDASQIYAGGTPVNDDISNGYTGCLQDIRLDQFVLPTSGSNDFASVTFGGSSGIIQGCTVGPCFTNPCGSGNCTELGGTSFACNCSDGTVQLGRPCQGPRVPPTGILAIAVGVGGGVLALLVILVIAGKILFVYS